ncbi:MAG: hypothetical protein KDD00_01125 [Ignavibacteriae bacterium]|nr:hypothetical protein [Ignavibacteriota bacterium]
MLKTSLIEILKTFSSEELKKFDDFVNSPYFNKKTPVINLWKEIKKLSPEFNSESLDRKLIYSKLFPSKEFNYGVMKNLIFDLTRLAENFTVIESFLEDELSKKLNLIYGLEDRNLVDLYVSKFETIEKTALDMSFKNNIVREDFYLWMWKLFMDKWNFDNQFIHTKSYEKNIHNSSDYFLAFILIKSFIMYHNIGGQKFIHNSLNEPSSIEIFLNEISSNNVVEKLISSIKPELNEVSTVLDVYHKMYLSVSENSTLESYLDFKHSLMKNTVLFSKNDLNALFITLSNCLGRNNFKEINHSEETLEIYEFRIENDLLVTHEGKLWDQEVIRYISMAGNMERIDLLEKFMDKMQNRIREETKENLIKFASANILLIKKEYNKALEVTSSIKFDLFTMKFYIKNLQLKIYYELNEYDPFSLSLDSYKHFLSRNKNVSDKMKSYNKSFCDFIEQLFEQKNNYDENIFEEVKIKIYEHYGKNNTWIMRKVREIELKFG